MKKSGKLSGRLARLRKSREQPVTAIISSGSKTGRGAPGAGWRKIAPYVYERETIIPLDTEDALQVLMAGERGGPLFAEKDDTPEGMLFYDLETTGLSGGAGTILFLAGFLRLMHDEKGSCLKALQIFLADYPGEPLFLERIASLCAPELLYVSYNGKSFDRHLLLSRCRMNGVAITMPRQLDLLYPARKFWKRVLPDCSLSTVETMLPGVKRSLDIPGSEIPDRYFEWLKTGSPLLLEPVFSHHLQDLHSLFLLLVRLEGMAGWPELCSPVELCALGEFLHRRGRGNALAVMLDAFERGDGRAGRNACVMLKRSGEKEAAMAVARQLWERERSPFAAIELAKYHEHVMKDYDQAMLIVDALLENSELLPEGFRRSLHHRRQRLVKRRYNSSYRRAESSQEK